MGDQSQVVDHLQKRSKSEITLSCALLHLRVNEKKEKKNRAFSKEVERAVKLLEASLVFFEEMEAKMTSDTGRGESSLFHIIQVCTELGEIYFKQASALKAVNEPKISKVYALLITPLVWFLVLHKIHFVIWFSTRNFFCFEVFEGFVTYNYLIHGHKENDRCSLLRQCCFHSKKALALATGKNSGEWLTRKQQIARAKELWGVSTIQVIKGYHAQFSIFCNTTFLFVIAAL